MKLQILVPQYKETDEIIKPLLDSIEVQQNVDLKNEVGVIIVNDGTDVHLSQELFDRYSFKIDYYLNEHKGVSATRNACLDHATADYVLFCDADYINHNMDSTFVHGKIHRRKFLLKEKIRWNDDLTIHEDSYFNCLCQRLAKELKYSQTPFYLWRWRDASVCRHDPKYILKTYNNMLDSNTALVKQFLKRKKKDEAMFYATSMIYDAYFTMNKDEWLNQENKEYRHATEKRFKEYWLEFKDLHDSIPQDVKTQIIMGIKNRMYGEGMILETMTFNEWIKQVENME